MYYVYGTFGSATIVYNNSECNGIGHKERTDDRFSESLMMILIDAGGPSTNKRATSFEVVARRLRITHTVKRHANGGNARNRRILAPRSDGITPYYCCRRARAVGRRERAALVLRDVLPSPSLPRTSLFPFGVGRPLYGFVSHECAVGISADFGILARGQRKYSYLLPMNVDPILLIGFAISLIIITK